MIVVGKFVIKRLLLRLFLKPFPTQGRRLKGATAKFIP